MSEKTEKLGVGLTEDEKKKIRVESAKRGVSMSELARKIILDELGDEGNLTRMTPETAD